MSTDISRKKTDKIAGHYSRKIDCMTLGLHGSYLDMVRRAYT